MTSTPEKSDSKLARIPTAVTRFKTIIDHWWRPIVLYMLLLNLLILFVLFDMTTVITSYVDLVKMGDTQEMRDQVAETTADLKAVSRCSTFQVRGLDQAARDCLKEALSKIRTAEGAAAASQVVSAWLFLHPDDDGLRESALSAIDQGWEDLRRTIPLAMRQQAYAKAIRESLLMRIRGKLIELDRAQEKINMLESATFAVTEPALAKTMMERRSAYEMERLSISKGHP